MPNAVGYIRVSTDKQADEGGGLEVQDAQEVVRRTLGRLDPAA